MITQTQNKQQTSARDKFILDANTKGFTPTEILVLLKREGFRPPVRSAIYDILARNKRPKK